MTDVLAINTASRSRIVVVRAGRDGGVRAAEVVRGAQVATSLPGLLQRMLTDDLEAVVVVVGPGTYTGVRAGMAAALGIAEARGLPLHGVGSLEVIANMPLPRAAGDAWVAADAGRGALYVATATAAASPRRVVLTDFDSGGGVLFSTDTLPLDRLVLIDPAEALVAAIPLAMSRPPLEPDGLAAMYVD